MRPGPTLMEAHAGVIPPMKTARTEVSRRIDSQQPSGAGSPARPQPRRLSVEQKMLIALVGLRRPSGTCVRVALIVSGEWLCQDGVRPALKTMARDDMVRWHLFPFNKGTVFVKNGNPQDVRSMCPHLGRDRRSGFSFPPHLQPGHGLWMPAHSVVMTGLATLVLSGVGAGAPFHLAGEALVRSGRDSYSGGTSSLCCAVSARSASHRPSCQRVAPKHSGGGPTISSRETTLTQNGTSFARRWAGQPWCRDSQWKGLALRDSVRLWLSLLP